MTDSVPMATCRRFNPGPSHLFKFKDLRNSVANSVAKPELDDGFCLRFLVFHIAHPDIYKLFKRLSFGKIVRFTLYSNSRYWGLATP